MKILPHLSFGSFIALLLLPTISHIPNLAQEKSIAVTGLYVIFSISLLLLPLVVVRPRVYIYLLLPFLLLMPLELIHVRNYDGYSTLAAFVSSIGTNLGEAIEFQHSYRPYFYVLYPLTLVVVFANLKFVKADYRLIKPITTGIALCFFVVLSAFTAKSINNMYAKNDDRITNGLSELYSRLFHQNFPYSYFLKGYEYILHYSALVHAQDMRKDFTFGAKADQFKLQNTNPVVVLVIGETSRANNWQFHGYDRATNPRLTKREHLVYFSDAISAATHTTQTLQLVLTRATPLNTSPFYNEKSIVTAFSEAGYKTVWLSNQNMTGAVETSLYATTAEADEVVFTGADYEVNPQMDAILVPQLKKILLDNLTQPLFVVIHTMGSHEVYRKRYPSEFEIFKPASRGDDYNFASTGIRTRLLNSYDNSILYTDYVLDLIIDTVAESGRIATVTYFSDHGENILDDGTNRFGHGGVIPTLYVTDIPLFVWTSDKFRSYYNEKHNALIENASKPISNLYLFDTLLDIGEIQIEGYAGEKSLARRGLSPYERYVLTSGYKPMKYEDIRSSVMSRENHKNRESHSY